LHKNSTFVATLTCSLSINACVFRLFNLNGFYGACSRRIGVGEFVMKAGRVNLYVDNLCYHIHVFRLFNCGSCGQTIGACEFVNKTEHAVAGGGRAVYHVQCFKCATCRQQLMPGDRYGIVNGAILCERDLVRANQGQ